MFERYLYRSKVGLAGLKHLSESMDDSAELRNDVVQR